MIGFKAFSCIDGESLQFTFLLSSEFVFLFLHLFESQNFILMEFDLSFHWVFNLSWLSNKAIMDSSSNLWLNLFLLRIRASHLNVSLWLRISIWIDSNRVRIVDVRLLRLNLISNILHLSTSSLSFSPTKFEDYNSENCSSSNHSNFEYMVISFSFSFSLLSLLFSQIFSIYIILICLKFFIKWLRSLVLTMLRMFRLVMVFFHVGSLMVLLWNLLGLCLSYHLIQLFLSKRSIDSLAFDFLGGD